VSIHALAGISEGRISAPPIAVAVGAGEGAVVAKTPQKTPGSGQPIDGGKIGMRGNFRAG
jgi:hypothetical protein